MTKTIDFSKYSSIKVGPTVEVKLFDDDFSDINNYFLIGGANNLLISNNPPKLALLSKKYDYIEYKDGVLKVGGATPSGKVHSFCKKNNIGGLEFLGKLPGKFGGLVRMNAGMKEYEIFNILESVTTHKNRYLKDEIEFGYRYTNIEEIILESTFKIREEFHSERVELFESMRFNQPKQPSAGSFFKNPVGDSAGRLIEAVGLKGFRQGNMAWSEIHANFLVNLGGGTFEDGKYLVDLAKRKVKEQFNIDLEEEVIVL